MTCENKKQIPILIVLAASFLIESPLRATLLSVFSFSQPLANFVISIVFYLALFACFMIGFKNNINSKSVLKSICLSLGLFVFEKVISVFLFAEIIALSYEIIRPIIIFAVVCLGNYWLSGKKPSYNKAVWVILGGAFVIGALFNILEYTRLIAGFQNMGNDYLSYLNMLNSTSSAYSILSKLCTYIITFTLFTK